MILVLHRLRFRALGSAAPLAFLLASSCLVEDPPAYSPPPGVFVGGECMCATCWNHAFCLNTDTNDFAETESDGSCPDGMKLSQQTARIDPTLGARDDAPLFCVADQTAADLGKLLNPELLPGTKCPSGDAERIQLGYVNMCKDIPTDCRSTTCTEHGDPDLCSFTSDDRIGDYRTACAANSVSAANKLQAESCAAHGFDIPSGDAPARYCYLNCWEEINELSTCDPALFDPPGTDSETVLADLDPEQSVAFLTITSSGGNDSGRLQMRGTVGLRFSKNCLPPLDGDVACDHVTLTLLDIESTTSTSLLDRNTENVVVHNPEPLPMSGQTTVLGSFIMFNLDRGAQLYVTADVEGLGRLGVAYKTAGAIGGSIRWSNRELSLAANISDGTDPRTAMQLVLTGTVRNRLPVARAGEEQAVECTSPDGASVRLDGGGSVDPDGDSDLVSFQWSWANGDGPRQAGGQEVDVSLPLGDTLLQLTVADRAGATSTDSAQVTVVDSQGPEITLSEQAGFATCDSNEVVLIPPVATDACSDDVTLLGEVVAIDGSPVTPIPIVDGKVTVEPGTITVRWTATDAHGLASTADQDVTVGRSVALFSNDSMKIGPNCNIVTEDGLPGAIVNVGGGKVQLASRVHCGDVSSIGSIHAASQVLIDGDVETTGTFQSASGVQVTGSISQGVPVSLPVVPTLDVDFPAPAGGDVMLNNGQSRTLTPGSFDRVQITKGSKLTLQGGTFFFRELRVLPGATLLTSGGAALYVLNDLHWQGSLEQAGAGSLFIGLAGDKTAVVNAPLRASLVAPHAKVVLGGDFAGQLFADSIDVGPNVEVTCGD